MSPNQSQKRNVTVHAHDEFTLTDLHCFCLINNLLNECSDVKIYSTKEKKYIPLGCCLQGIEFFLIEYIFASPSLSCNNSMIYSHNLDITDVVSSA
jgi:hypothetical protein